jgi:hypothetical protein
MKTINFTLEDLGLEIFHDRWKRVALWRMEEHHKHETWYLQDWSDEMRKDLMLYERDRRLGKIRSKKAYDMRTRGCTYKVIGEALNVSGNRARQIVTKYKYDLTGVWT